MKDVAQRSLHLCILCVMTVSAISAPSAVTPSRFEFAEPHMGTVARVVLYAADAETAGRAAQAAFARIGDLDRRLSDYRDDSEINTICRVGVGESVPVSADLFAILERAQALAARSSGAFDVTAAPVVQLWRRARRTGRVPDPERLRESLARTGYGHLRLDAARRAVTFDRPGMRLDLGGIAKGYAADRALATLGDAGVARALVAIGGDIAVGDAPVDATGWKIAIVVGADLGRPDHGPGRPGPYLSITRAGISTSGDSEQHVEIDGVRYSHIIDPRTGVPVRGRSSVTVIAPDATASDALATAASVLGPDEGLALADAQGARALMTVITDQGDRRYYSARWSERITKNEKGIMNKEERSDKSKRR
jgi:thiamine biosynthesis lipoprotein